MAELERRWRLVLGKYSDGQLPSPEGQDVRLDGSMAFLYDRLYGERGLRPDQEGERGAGLEESSPHVVDWLDAIRELFPDEISEELTKEAVERFGINEILTDPEHLERITPNEDTLRLLLSLKSNVSGDAMRAVRRVIAAVVEEITESLRTELLTVLTGRVNRQSRTRRPTGVIDALRTIDRNLGTWDAERQRLLIEEVTFFNRSQMRYPWEVVLCIDQSGSMVGSVIHSAIMAGILASLPGVTVKVVVFDTSVVDLTNLSNDPVEMLMSVQLGGGTDIAQAMQYCEQIVGNPSRTIVALVTDFYEGGSVAALLSSINRLAESGVTLMGLAALEDGAGPSFDHTIAQRAVEAGMPVAAMTPKSFAQWAAGVMN